MSDGSLIKSTIVLHVLGEPNDFRRKLCTNEYVSEAQELIVMDLFLLFMDWTLTGDIKNSPWLSKRLLCQACINHPKVQLARLSKVLKR